MFVKHCSRRDTLVKHCTKFLKAAYYVAATACKREVSPGSASNFPVLGMQQTFRPFYCSTVEVPTSLLLLGACSLFLFGNRTVCMAVCDGVTQLGRASCVLHQAA